MSITIDKGKLTDVGNNVKYGKVGDDHIIVISDKIATRPSSKGKMDLLATANWGAYLPGGFKINLQFGKPANKAV